MDFILQEARRGRIVDFNHGDDDDDNEEDQGWNIDDDDDNDDEPVVPEEDPRGPCTRVWIQ